MRRFALVLLFVIGFIGIVAAALAWVVATGPGLRWALQLAAGYVPGTLQFERIEGRLLGPVRLEGVAFRSETGTAVDIGSVDLDWRPRALVAGTLHVTTLTVSGLKVEPGEESDAPPEPLELPDISVPVALKLDRVVVERAEVAGFALQEIHAAASLAKDQLHVREFEIRADKVAAELDARVRLRGTYPTDLSLAYTAILPDGQRVAGNASVKGDIERAEVTADAGDVLSLRGELRKVLSGLSWQVELQARQWQPSAWFAGSPPGQVSGDLSSEGDLRRARARGRLDFADTQAGNINTVIDIRWADRTLSIDKLEVAGDEDPATASVTGTVRFRGPGDIAYDLSAQWRGLRGEGWSTPEGQLSLSGTTTQAKASLTAQVGDGSEQEQLSPVSARVELRGIDTARPWISVDADAPSLYYRDSQLIGLSARAVVDTTDAERSEIDVRANSLEINEHVIEGISIAGAGTTAEHDVMLQARHSAGQIELALSGAYREQRWEGLLNTLDVQTRDAGAWRLVKAAPVRAALDQAALEQMCLVMAEGHGQACVNGHWNLDSGWGGDVNVERLALMPWISLWRPDVAWDGELTIEAEVAGDTVLRTARVRASSQCCTIGVTDAGEAFTTQYRNLGIDLDLQADGVNGKASVELPEYGFISSTMRIPGAPEQEWRDRAVDAAVAMELTTLKALQPLVPEVRLEKGAAAADLRIKGQLGDPKLAGTVKVDRGEIHLPAAGVKLEQLEILVRAEGAERARLTSSARAGEGTLQVTGEMRWPRPGSWQAEFAVEGNRAEVIRIPEAQVIASPNLKITMAPDAIEVQGKVDIDEARIMPQLAQGGGVVLSPDVVIVTEESGQPAAAARVRAKVRTELGDKTVFDSYGLAGYLRGGIEVLHETGRATRATGEIRVEDGTYTVYGQKLKIETGRLLFAGGDIEDPGLDVRASRQVNEVTAGVLVRGTVTEPTLKLYSEPSMPDSELLSYLLLGRPPTAKGSSADAALLASAAQSLLPKSGAGVTGRVKSTLGLEQLSLESTGTENGRALVLGKYLSPKLYVAYAAGLAGAANVFRVRYQLAKRWLVQTESSDRQSGGELMFSIEK